MSIMNYVELVGIKCWNSVTGSDIAYGKCQIYCPAGGRDGKEEGRRQVKGEEKRKRRR